QCLQALGHVARAADSLAEGLQQLPQHPELVGALIEWECRHGHLERAIALAQQQAAHRPEDAGAWHLLGALQQQAGDLQGADTSFNEVQQRDMGRWDALLRRAQVQLHWQQPAAAEWLLRQVLAQQPQHRLAQALLGKAQLELGQTEAARRQLLQSLRAEPRHGEAWRVLAQLHAQRGRWALARRCLARAARCGADEIEVLQQLGWLAKEQGDLGTATASVRELLRRRPG